MILRSEIRQENENFMEVFWCLNTLVQNTGLNFTCMFLSWFEILIKICSKVDYLTVLFRLSY